MATLFVQCRLMATLYVHWTLSLCLTHGIRHSDLFLFVTTVQPECVQSVSNPLDLLVKSTGGSCTWKVALPGQSANFCRFSWIMSPTMSTCSIMSPITSSIVIDSLGSCPQQLGCRGGAFPTMSTCTRESYSVSRCRGGASVSAGGASRCLSLIKQHEAAVGAFWTASHRGP